MTDHPAGPKNLLSRVLGPNNLPAPFKLAKGSVNVRPLAADLPDASEVLQAKTAISPIVATAAAPGQALVERDRHETQAAADAFTAAAPPALAPAISLRILPGEKSLEMQSSAAIAAALAPVGAEIKLTIRW